MFKTLVLAGVSACLAPMAHAQLSGNVTQENGYEVTRSETLVRPPHGKLGRKTISRETRIGNTEDTDGNSFTSVMTLGGFVNKCPVPDESNAGKFVVPGVAFEYSLTADQVNTDEGETQRTHYAKRVEVTLIKAHLNDDATVKEIEVDALYTSDLDGVRTGPIRDRRTIRLGEGGMPDMDALKHAVAATGDLAIAALLWNASTAYYTAQSDESAWLRAINACVEFAFDPPSDERALGSNQSEQVRVTLQTKEGKHPVARAKFEGGPLNGIGQLAPRQGDLNNDGQVTLTYTASANPKAGHGFEVGTRSPAGLADAKWRIADRVRFEGTFDYKDSASAASGLGGHDNFIHVTGNLVWTPANDGQSPTFGDVQSSFFKPSAGEITVETGFANQGLAGSKCEGQGRKTFPFDSLTPGALRYMLLEIADDGRYKLTLVIPDTPDSFPPWEFEAVCSFPNASSRQRQPVRHVSMVLGVQQGMVDHEQAVAGQLSSPIRRGPRSITGSWSFARVQP
jgi:hypothetical protein